MVRPSSKAMSQSLWSADELINGSGLLNRESHRELKSVKGVDLSGLSVPGDEVALRNWKRAFKLRTGVKVRILTSAENRRRSRSNSMSAISDEPRSPPGSSSRPGRAFLESMMGSCAG